ncbi:MAG: hypothetical protein M3253_05615 [Chloroflexota bacterium]|nr:hypothetical protein [Chloroflexota bacterium]
MHRLAVLAGGPLPLADDRTTTAFVLLVLLAGSVAAGLFVGSPLRRRNRRPRAKMPGNAWSTGQPERDERPAAGSGGSPWSTDRHDRNRLQRDR